MRRVGLLLVVALAATGCVLPFGTAAPQPATTAGKGRYTLGAHTELPTIDVLKSEKDDDYVLTPIPITSFEFGYGIHERLDLEVSLDVALFVFLPVPLGGSSGFRAQIFRNSTAAMTAAARVGYVGMTSGSSSDNDPGHTVSAVYGTGSLSTIFNPDGWLSPGLSLNYYGASVKDDPENDVATRSFANLGSATLYLDVTRGPGHFGPFVNFVAVDTDLGKDALVTAGLFFYARFGDRPEQPPPAPAGPGPFGPPGAM